MPCTDSSPVCYPGLPYELSVADLFAWIDRIYGEARQLERRFERCVDTVREKFGCNTAQAEQMALKVILETGLERLENVR